ncbi:MAG: T9SS type A sorting domain-containing protein, partial [Flavobacteriaceae bacterium]
ALSNEEVNTSLLNAYKEVNANYITIEGLATQATSTEVSLYNILGTRVMDTTLDNTVNTQTISTNRFSTGIYIIKLESGKNQLTKKLIIK